LAAAKKRIAELEGERGHPAGDPGDGVAAGPWTPTETCEHADVAKLTVIRRPEIHFA
jgi:hypothetical protein